MEKNMDTTRVYRGYIGIMENKMENTIVCEYLVVKRCTQLCNVVARLSWPIACVLMSYSKNRVLLLHPTLILGSTVIVCMCISAVC